MADWLPGVSQAKSLVQLACGDTEGAKRTQENFTKQCPGVSQIRSLVEVASGDTDAALQTQKECLGTISGMVDAIPVVGHAKGGIHYICGDKDGGDNAMKASSRTTGVMAGGAGGFLVGGPVGAVAGGMAGASVMDTVTSIVDSEVHGDSRPTGYIKQIGDIIEDPKDPGKWFDVTFSAVGDAMTGYSGGQAVKNLKNFKNQREVRNKFDSQRQALSDKIGKKAANDMVKAADHLKKTQKKYSVPENKPHVTAVVHDLETNKIYDGHNKQVRNFCKRTKFGLDPISDYSSDVNSPTLVEKRAPKVETPLARQARSCAEHRAYHKYYKDNPAGAPKNTRVSVVRYDKATKTIRTAERCGNCKSYSNAMGKAPGDGISNQVVPNHPKVGKLAHFEHAGNAAANMVEGGVFQNLDEDEDDY
ncbi:hypothetical protein LOTGIDRAFT_160555 [Lottia gigantea]|uniref:Uncharacterized protein n=1 Tax=Lottia gigantea TaxID=225164 RepID=V4AEX8_LOTGI|nr:hypothetical protein LOTGIDRAFT_160555 [Lottia gigantea]ESO95417.1 hypothetical protein LOTGIDRAFT_160555 [Lottia gigantea]